MPTKSLLEMLLYLSLLCARAFIPSLKIVGTLVPIVEDITERLFFFVYMTK